VKLFSIFNKPDSKLNNKQKGQTFMELVIILLIAGTAVICIIWYFYWVLQSSVIDFKHKLEDARTAMASQCGLPKPEGDQPTVFYQKTYPDFTAMESGSVSLTDEIPYPHHKIVIHNIDPTNSIEFEVHYRIYINKEINGTPPTWWYYIDYFTLGHGDKYEHEFDNGWIIDFFMINFSVDVSSDIGPYNTRIIATGPDNTPYTVTVSELP